VAPVASLLSLLVSLAAPASAPASARWLASGDHNAAVNQRGDMVVAWVFSRPYRRRQSSRDHGPTVPLRQADRQSLVDHWPGRGAAGITSALTAEQVSAEAKKSLSSWTSWRRLASRSMKGAAECCFATFCISPANLIMTDVKVA